MFIVRVYHIIITLIFLVEQKILLIISLLTIQTSKVSSKEIISNEKVFVLMQKTA